MVERLGWTLVHSAWEIAAVALLLAFALLLARQASARLRYGIACLALVAMAILPVVTFVILTPPPVAHSVLSPGKVWSPGASFIVDARPVDGRMPLLVQAWAFGVILLSLRMVGTLIHVERWRRRNTQPAGSDWQARADALARRLGLSHAATLLVSERVGAPSAWGVLKPFIVLPTSLVTHLSPSEVETILLHELAHIRRHDYLINLFQTVVETVLFYHPAVWWASAVVRQEREHCCDDVVVAALGDPIPYARALLHLEERRQTLPRPTLSAKEGKLMNRIARILGAKPAPVRVSPLASAFAALGVLGAVLGGAFQAQAQTKKPAPKPVAKTATKKVVAKPAPAAAPAPVAKTKPTAKPTPAAKPALKAGETITILPNGNARYFIKAGETINLAPTTSPIVTTKVATTTQRAATASPKSFLSQVGAKASPQKFGASGWVRVADNGQAATALGGQGVNGTGEHTAVAVGGGFSATQGQGSVNAAKGLGGGAFGSTGQAFGSGVNPNAPRAGQGGGFGGFGGGGGFSSGASDSSVEMQGQRVLIDVKADRFSPVLLDLAKKAKISVVVAPGNYDILQLVLNEASVEDAIEILCRAAGATFRKEKGVYYVSPKAPASAPMPGGFPGGGLGGGGFGGGQ